MIHFGTSEYEDFTGALTKLHQTTIVKEYQNHFDKLANHKEGLDDTFFTSCFISGLKEEHKIEVKIFNPKTMMDAIALAKLAEDKASAQRRNVRPPFTKTHNNSHSSNNTSAPPPN